MISALAMSLMLVVALGIFAVIMRPRVRLLLTAAKAERFDQIPRRLVGMIRFALFQGRMPRDPVAGVMHILIFAGFVVVQIATVQHLVRAYVPGFVVPPLWGRAQDVYVLVKDVFESLVLVGVTYGLWRRLKPTPSRVGRSWEGIFVLCMIGGIMVTDFFIYGAELVVAGAHGLPWNPAGHVASLALAPLGAEAAHLVGQAMYWLHCAIILVFLNFLPLGKHFHILTSFPNVFFRRLDPAIGVVPKIDLENSEKFGVQTTADLSWKMVLDTYSCTECGRCNVYCPTVLTQKPLSHRQLNLDLKGALYDDYGARFGGKLVGNLHGDGEAKTESAPAGEVTLADLIGGRISPDTIWACTTCGSCEQECPVFIENVPRIIQMRQHKVLMEGDVTPELQRAFKGMENNSNPWGIGFDKRDEWANGLDVPRMADVASGEGEPPLLYWIGCAGSFDDRNKKITLAMVKILRAAGVQFAILGKEEGCTGDPARRTGNEYLFQMLAANNVETLNKYKVKRILTHCPHCYHSLKAEYPDFGGKYELVHHTQLIDELITGGKLKLEKTVETSVALHDSCYLGRYHDIYDAPRNVVKAIPGAKLVELPRNRSRSVCCGAGGGRFWMEEHIGERINEHRAKEALSMNTDTVGSACPFCLIMMRDGVAAQGKEDVKTRDVAEIVAEAI